MKNEIVDTIPLKGMRGAVARNMNLGWQVPQATLCMEVNMNSIYEQQLKLQEASGSDKKISVNAFIVKAVALALKDHPHFNSLLKEKEVEIYSDINIALAVSVEGGLATPVIRNTDGLSINEIAKKTADLAQGSRNMTLPPNAYQGGTFTISNLGMTEVDLFIPILNPPQVGILGISRSSDKAKVKNGQVSIEPTSFLTLVFDHRAVDGYPASLFLKCIKNKVENFEQWLE